MPLLATKSHLNRRTRIPTWFEKPKMATSARCRVQPDEWMSLFRALDLPNLLEDPSYYVDAAVDTEKLTNTINNAFETFTTEEMQIALEREDVPFSKINSREEVLEDPQVKAMDSIWEFDHPLRGQCDRQDHRPGSARHPLRSFIALPN